MIREYHGLKTQKGKRKKRGSVWRVDLDANGGREDANNNGEKSFKHVSSFSGKICCEHTAQLNLGHHITILKWQTESGCYTACHDHSPGSIN